MKPRLIARWLATLTGAAALLIAGAVLAADVHVMISAGFFQAYSELAPVFAVPTPYAPKGRHQLPKKSVHDFLFFVLESCVLLLAEESRQHQPHFMNHREHHFAANRFGQLTVARRSAQDSAAVVISDIGGDEAIDQAAATQRQEHVVRQRASIDRE